MPSQRGTGRGAADAKLRLGTLIMTLFRQRTHY